MSLSAAIPPCVLLVPELPPHEGREADRSLSASAAGMVYNRPRPSPPAPLPIVPKRHAGEGRPWGNFLGSARMNFLRTTPLAALVLNLLLVPPAAAAAGAPALIPKPVQVTVAAGQFVITPATKVLCGKGDARLADAAEYLAGRLSRALAEKVEAQPTGASQPPAGAIWMTTGPADTALGDEGYRLTVGPTGVVIRAPQAAGAFYAAITLLQLAPPQAFRAGPG